MTIRLTPDPTSVEPDPTTVAVAIGSNLDDRRAHLAFAIERLTRLLDSLRVSTVLETAPVETPDSQPDYLNAVAVGSTRLQPAALLEALLAIERERGRTRAFQNAARTLDLDLVLYGDRVIESAGLIVPHPRFRERRFVLVPLAELTPDWRDPVTSLTIAELLARWPPASSTPAP